MASSSALILMFVNKIADLDRSLMQEGMSATPAVMQKSCLIASRLFKWVMQQFSKKPNAFDWLIQIHQGFKNCFRLLFAADQFRLQSAVG